MTQSAASRWTRTSACAGMLADGDAEVDLAACLGPGDQEVKDGGRRTSRDTTASGSVTVAGSGRWRMPRTRVAAGPGDVDDAERAGVRRG